MGFLSGSSHTSDLLKASASRASDPEFNSYFLRGNFSGSSHTSDLVKASASRASDPEFDSRFIRGNFSGSSHTSDLKTGIPVATLPGARRYRVSAGTRWPGVSIL